MTSQHTFATKITYLVVIAVLLLPLYVLGHPSTRRGGAEVADRSQLSSGGTLQQMRDEHGFSHADIGKIDPASETIKLATLGLRGVALHMLGRKADEFKKRKDWINLSATLNQMMLIEPHFVSIWRFQGWNLAYNVSTEFDDYRERYRWVRHGIEFLIEGTDYIANAPRLQYDVGWTVGHKIGRADEHEQYRRLFRNDDEFHERYGTPSRDSWLCAKWYYRQAEAIVDDGRGTLGKFGPLPFFSAAPLCDKNYAESLQEEGVFSERLKLAWHTAGEEWHAFGNRPIQTTYLDEHGEHITIALNDLQRLNAETEAAQDAIEALEPGLRHEILWQRWNNLTIEEQASMYELLTEHPDVITADHRWLADKLSEETPDWEETLKGKRLALLTEEEIEAIDTAEKLRTPRQKALANVAFEKLFTVRDRARSQLNVDYRQVAREMEGEKRQQALELAEQLEEHAQMRDIVRHYRNTINFDSWERSIEMNQLDQAIAARKALYEARQLYDEGDLAAANEKYLECLQRWEDLFDEGDNKRLLEDGNISRELRDRVERYTVLLDQLDERYPEDYPLAEIFERLVEDEYPEVRHARELTADAEEMMAEGQYEQAQSILEMAFDEWALVLNLSPSIELMSHRAIGNDMMHTVDVWARCLLAQGMVFPAETFELRSFVVAQVAHADALSDARFDETVGDGHRAKSEFAEAEAAYAEAIEHWTALLEQYPILRTGFNEQTLRQIQATLVKYREVLQRQGKEFPNDLPILELLKAPEPAQQTA